MCAMPNGPMKIRPSSSLLPSREDGRSSDGSTRAARTVRAGAATSQPPQQASSPQGGDPPDALLASRLLLTSLVASVPPEGAMLAKEVLHQIAAQGGGEVNQMREAIAALRFLKSHFSAPRTANPRVDYLHSEFSKAVHELNQPLAHNSWGAPAPARDAALREACLGLTSAADNNTFRPPPGLGPDMRNPYKQQNREAPQAARTRRREVPPVEQKGKPQSLRAVLRELQSVEQERILLVRKINCLGFEAAGLLKDHFSQYGRVERVLVPHSQVKSSSALSRQAGMLRFRPSGLGFLVFRDPKAVEAILRLGEDQRVGAGKIRVCKFERRTKEGSDAEGESDAAEEET